MAMKGFKKIAGGNSLTEVMMDMAGFSPRRKSSEKLPTETLGPQNDCGGSLLL